MSKFDKHMALALNVQHNEMGDMAIITIKGKPLDNPVSVIIREAFGQTKNSEGMLTVISVKRSDMPEFFSNTLFELDGKKYKADDLFVGDNFESNQYEWRIAVRRV